MKDFMKAVEEEEKIITTRSKNKHPFVVTPDAHAMEARVGIHLMDGVLDWEKVCYAFWKTYTWTLHYFKTSEVLDWCWYYPYAEAPLIKTLCDCEITYNFEWEHPEPPFGIEEQINFIMPGLGVFPDERYEEGPDSRHPWMKAYAWETDPLISLPWNPSKPMTHVTWIDSTA
jgi:5'-3' exonuclease